MLIMLNGEGRETTERTVRELVANLTGRDVNEDGTPTDGGRLGVAVALGGEVVARGKWANTPLHEGDSVELVTASQGG